MTASAQRRTRRQNLQPVRMTQFEIDLQTLLHGQLGEHERGQCGRLAQKIAPWLAARVGTVEVTAQAIYEAHPQSESWETFKHRDEAGHMQRTAGIYQEARHVHAAFFLEDPTPKEA